MLDPAFLIDAPASRLVPGEVVEIWVPLGAVPESALRRALLASYLPARRASRADPVRPLRSP